MIMTKASGLRVSVSVPLHLTSPWNFSLSLTHKKIQKKNPQGSAVANGQANFTFLPLTIKLLVIQISSPGNFILFVSQTPPFLRLPVPGNHMAFLEGWGGGEARIWSRKREAEAGSIQESPLPAELAKAWQQYLGIWETVQVAGSPPGSLES